MEGQAETVEEESGTDYGLRFAKALGEERCPGLAAQNRPGECREMSAEKQVAAQKTLEMKNP